MLSLREVDSVEIAVKGHSGMHFSHAVQYSGLIAAFPVCLENEIGTGPLFR